MNQTTGQIIRGLRHARGWTQRQLAEAAGISTIAVKRLESDQHAPSNETLRRLARAFNMSTDDLMGQSEQDDPFPAANLRDWGVSDAEVEQYRAAWPYWSRRQRIKFLGDLRTIRLLQADVQAMTEDVQAKIRALDNRANQEDDPDEAAPALTPQIAL